MGPILQILGLLSVTGSQKFKKKLEGSISFLLCDVKIISVELEIDSCLCAIVLKNSRILDSRARRNHRRLYVMLYSYFNLKRFRDFILYFL